MSRLLPPGVSVMDWMVRENYNIWRRVDPIIEPATPREEQKMPHNMDRVYVVMKYMPDQSRWILANESRIAGRYFDTYSHAQNSMRKYCLNYSTTNSENYRVEEAYYYKYLTLKNT